MEDSGLELTRTPDSLDLTTKDFDHMMMLSKYELDVKDMEKRVSNIERMSAELQNIEGISMSDIELTPDRSPGNSLKTVQTAYEKTLESTEKFNSPTCDELAKRLSKELKIRGSSGKKVVRSPSARKIGTIRRRSREGVPKIKRNLSLDITGMVLSSHSFNQNGHRVGKSDTPRNCLPNPSIKPTDTLQEHFKNQLKSQAYENQRESCSGSFGHESNDLLSFGVLTRSKTQRASSFHGYDFNREPINTPNSVKTENTNTSIDSLVWKNAETFLNEEVKSEEKPTTGRPSLAKIRSQNAGMVLAKAKMFNTMTCSNKDSDPPINLNSKCQGLQKKNSSKSSKDKKLPRKKSGNEKKQANQETALESSSSLVKTDMKSLSDNKVKKNIRSNESAHYHQIKGNKGSIRKTSLLDQNVLRAQHPIINKLKANHLHISSPLRDRNFLNSPRVCGVTNIGKTNTPRVPRQLPTNQVKTAAKKPAGSTPRRSPRQPSYKSKYVTKSLV